MKEFMLVICFAVIIFCAIATVKNINTFNCHDAISEAIYKYKTACIEECDWDALHLVEYGDMEDYNKTFWRFWDWDIPEYFRKISLRLLNRILSKRT